MTNTRLVVDLIDVEASKLLATGGKASNLTILANAGFPVPRGFVVTTDAYTKFIQLNHLESLASDYLKNIHHEDAESLGRATSKMRGLAETAVLPEDLAEAVKLAYSKLGSGPVAIRSSATAEDLPETSFAGQYDTSLYIEGIDSVLQHIKRCFGSVWTERAVSYREENRIQHERVRIAVVVQTMVDARTAGVLFTKNPLSSSNNEMMIESNFGLGESVVGGYAVPDRYLILKSASELDDFTLISREIGTKDTVIVRAKEGIGVELSTPAAEKSQESSLDDDEVIKLASIGKSIEELFKLPQDIEWAIDHEGRIHVLQARPITTDLKADGKEKDDIFWTRGYADDYWNDPVTPLFYSLLGDQITHIVNVEANAIMGYKNTPNELLKLHKSHAYFNLDVIRTKVVNEMPPFIRSDDVMNYFPEGNGPYGKETMRKLPFALATRIMAEIRVMLFDGDGSMTKTNSVYEMWTKDVFEPACTEFDVKLASLQENGSLSDILELADDLDKTMMRHFRMVRYGLPVHTLGMNLITNYLLKRWLGEKAAIKLYPVLLSGLEHKTSETNRRIEELAAAIRNDSELSRVILETPSHKILSRLEKNSSVDSIFLSKYNEFIDDFGDRGFTRELYYPRWRESPEYVFDALKSLVSESGRDSRQVEAALTKKRVIGEKIVKDTIRKQRFGPIKWTLFSTILGMARTYIGFRENQRFNLDRWITRERNAYLEIGKRLAAKGYLQEQVHVFFLFRDEIRRIIRGNSNLGKDDVKALVEKRYEEFLKYENITPPKFLQGGREFDDPLPEYAEGFKGMPASQGVITGQVRVLGAVEEVPQVLAGEILVVPRTDPGWTPVFSKIGGLITETGGILSHGAVVSREFGIPAVTNVRNACRIFKTGQRVTVDGNLGVVVKHETG
ncbi:MAG: PEP/pyruvate-binding domain-containing protein [Candidatus Thorarchaeota archaeon]